MKSPFLRFSKRPVFLPTSPLRINPPGENVAMNGRERPIHWSLDKPVLNGITPAIVHMSGEISLVANAMLPETALPDTSLLLCALG